MIFPKFYFCVCLIFTLLSFEEKIFAQNAYKGGEGDGFAFTELKININSFENEPFEKYFQITNPVSKGEKLHIRNELTEFFIEIFDLSGQKIFEAESENKLVQFASDKLPAGTYLLQISIRERKFFFKQVIF